MHQHLILAHIRPNPLHHVATTRNIQLDLEIAHRSDPLRHLPPHHRPFVNIPYQATGPSRLVPCKAVSVPLWCGEVVDVGVDDAMFVVVFGVGLAPMEAGVVDGRTVPCLEDVDFAIGGPGEGLEWEEPECGPDAFYRTKLEDGSDRRRN